MRVLFTCLLGLPHTGGLQTYLNVLSDELRRLGHQVDTLALHHNQRCFLLMEGGRSLSTTIIRQPLTRLGSLRGAKPKRPMPPLLRYIESTRYAFELAALYFGLESYQVIHAQDVMSARAMRRVKPSDVPLVLTAHMGWDHPFPYVSFQEQIGVRSTDLTITPSQWLKNRFVSRYQIPPHQITVIPNGLDPRPFADLPGPSGGHPPHRNKILLCTARLSPEKGHSVLLDALAAVRRVRNDWVCWLAGDGSLRKPLTERTRRLRLQNHVLFLGNQQDVTPCLQQADIFVLPSMLENCPFSVVEAFLAGKPVVATEAGGLPEMVAHVKTGLLSPVGDSEALARNLLAVMEQPALGRLLAESARTMACERYTSQRMAVQTAAAYQHALLRTTGGNQNGTSS